MAGNVAGIWPAAKNCEKCAETGVPSCLGNWVVMSGGSIWSCYINRVSQGGGRVAKSLEGFWAPGNWFRSSACSMRKKCMW